VKGRGIKGERLRDTKAANMIIIGKLSNAIKKEKIKKH